uniref:Glycoprotein (transmembrane) nmb n=1 Tax=Neogobius melanostomus TaxID=47308 RepID=A0A8C6U8T0_9GOBI
TRVLNMFPHKHTTQGWFPFPIPPIPGWNPDSTPWDDTLYPPMQTGPNEFQRHRGKPKVVLTSDSPALNGSSVSFTAKLQYPPCQKEGTDGDLLWDEHCEDANGQVRSGYVYNWTSWLEDYGYGRCADPKKCNVFPDGKPFPQSNDWRHKNYVYVWHTRGQYYETCDGSSSSLSLNTSALPLGAEVMEVLVYRQRERRKYSPLTTDSTVYHITDKIPVIVKMSQKSAANMSDGVFFRGEEVLFQVLLHDPSEYLKMAFSVDYLWDFRDGNQLVTHREVITHTYSTAGRRSVSLVVEAAFPIECPPAAETSTLHMTPQVQHPFPAPGPLHCPRVYVHFRVLLHRALPPTVTPSPEGPSTTGPWLHRHPANANQCFRYVHGSFTANISVIEPKPTVRSWPHNSKIIDVTAARESKTDISFLVKCMGSAPTSACTIVSDPSCSEVQSILCDDLPPSPQCLVHLRRSFSKPGTYCVNITLEDSHSVALASTKVSISKRPHTAEVVISSSAVLTALFALVAFMVYRKLYTN